MRRTVNALLAWFAFFGLAAGSWQMFAPEAFYRNFPGWGRHWVSVDGPYNEHLLRDAGQGNLAFGVVALVALLTRSEEHTSELQSRQYLVCRLLLAMKEPGLRRTARR